MKPAVAFAGAALALTASTATPQRTAAACGGLGTLSDPQRNLVRLRPKATTVAAINRLGATLPHPRCLSARTRARKAIVGARSLFEGLCGPARRAWRELGPVAVVDGVGYWGARHAELHPVTRVRLVAGCA